MKEKKVFIIDDDKFVLKSTAKLFRSYEVDVHCHNVPEVALRALIQHKPAIVFLDYHMPGLSGMDVIIKLSEERVLNEMALYMFSMTDFTNEDVVRLRTLGFYNIFKKPLKFSTIDQIFLDHLGHIPYKKTS